MALVTLTKAATWSDVLCHDAMNELDVFGLARTALAKPVAPCALASRIGHLAPEADAPRHGGFATSAYGAKLVLKYALMKSYYKPQTTVTKWPGRS